MAGRAVFLDRDGTLVEPRHYPTEPDQLRIYDCLPQELLAVQSLGFDIVVVTNQSAIARGLLDEATLHRLHEHLSRELRRWGVTVTAFYHCPHHPEGVIQELSISCGCRKPQPGMLLRAAQELDLDLERSWLVGDILDDVEAGNLVGCGTILIDLGTEPRPTTPIRTPRFVSRSTGEALQIVQWIEGGKLLGGRGLTTPVELDYIPGRWPSDGSGDTEHVLAEAGSARIRGLTETCASRADALPPGDIRQRGGVSRC